GGVGAAAPRARHKTLAFVTSCFFCGLMGAIHCHYLRFVSPFVFTFFFSTDLVIFNMVGGLGSFWGPLAGSVLLTALGEQLFAAGYYKSLVYALVLLVVILALPGGLIQLPRMREAWTARRLRLATAPAAAVARSPPSPRSAASPSSSAAPPRSIRSPSPWARASWSPSWAPTARARARCPTSSRGRSRRRGARYCWAGTT